MRLLLAMSPTILLVAYGQLVTKWRLGILSQLVSESPDRLTRLLTYLKDPLIVSTYFAALAGSFAWVFVLEKYDVAIAFPIYVGLTVLAVAILGAMMLGEHVGPWRLVGLVLIVAGVALVSRS